MNEKLEKGLITDTDHETTKHKRKKYEKPMKLVEFTMSEFILNSSFGHSN